MNLNQFQFTRSLQSVGQACFVKFFETFASNSLSREDVIERLKYETSYTEKSCISRTGHAQSIIKNGLAKKALETVIASDSPKVSSETRLQAQQLLLILNSQQRHASGRY